MKKKFLILIALMSLILFGCTNQEDPEDIIIEDYICKDTPLAEGCYIPSDDLNHISPIPLEYTIEEDFESDRVGQMPQNWLLYKNEEYQINGVIAMVAEAEGNRYVKMYSDGLKAPAYPQSAPTPTFIFTSKFNLDIDRKGIAYGSVMIPSDVTSNVISLGVATGAVNTISVVIDTDLKVSVKVGGPFFYYSGSGDGGDTYVTSHTLLHDEWYKFKFEWDAAANLIKAFIILNDIETELFSGQFHISSRYNAESTGAILVPNVFKVTMPRYMSGWAYLDDVIIERKGE
ncbi:MAG: hypothetical protein K9L02_00130 [Acholeplasmataceae bacterium]|nr:hypothetical protein [Acholeplasmataceae bacterium]